MAALLSRFMDLYETNKTIYGQRIRKNKSYNMATVGFMCMCSI